MPLLAIGETAMISAMDRLDRDIVSVVCRDPRISYRDLGAAVGLSANAAAAAAARLRRLLDDGGLRLVAVADEGATARLRVLVDVRLSAEVSDDEFEAGLRRFPGVVEAHHVTGDANYLLRADLPDTAGLDRLLRDLKRVGGAASTTTRVVLRSRYP